MKNSGSGSGCSMSPVNLSGVAQKPGSAAMRCGSWSTPDGSFATVLVIYKIASILHARPVQGGMVMADTSLVKQEHGEPRLRNLGDTERRLSLIGGAVAGLVGIRRGGVVGLLL